MDFFSKLFKNKVERISDSELKELIQHNKTLLDLYIVDYSILKELIIYLNKVEDKKQFINLIDNFYCIFNDNLNIFNKEINLKNFTLLFCYSNVFMIILLNLKHKKVFLEHLFEKNSKMISLIIKIIKSSKNFHNSNRISKVFCNLFFDEYKEIFFLHNDPNLEEMFILNHEKLSEIIIEGVDVYPKQIYNHILLKLLNLEINFENVFKYIIKNNDNPSKKESKYYYQEEDKSLSTFYFNFSKIRNNPGDNKNSLHKRKVSLPRRKREFKIRI